MGTGKRGLGRSQRAEKTGLADETMAEEIGQAERKAKLMRAEKSARVEVGRS
jgi:hypothetical protein